MAHAATIAAAAVRGSAQPVAYLDELECSPPPYPYCEAQLPPQFFYHANPPTDEPAEDPPEYSNYDVERGSLIDLALAQYTQSISPSVQSTLYSPLEQDEDAPFLRSDLSGRFRSFLFYCMAMFCGVTWAVFWVCAIGYAIVISFQKVAESLN
jgi:hypothetical protein